MRLVQTSAASERATGPKHVGNRGVCIWENAVPLSTALSTPVSKTALHALQTSLSEAMYKDDQTKITVTCGN